MARRTASVALCDNVAGVKLYIPTDTFKRFRLTYKDPFTGKRVQPAYWSLDQGTEAFHEAVAYVTAARAAKPVASRPGSQPIVDDVFEAVVERWRLKDREPAYVAGRVGAYNHRLAPMVGGLTVMEWGRDDTHCLSAIAALRDVGLAPSTIQNYGAILRQLVTVAHQKKWLPRSLNPMDEVEYVAKANQGPNALYVEPRMRPTTQMVDALIEQYRTLGEQTGRPWLWLMPEVGGFAGLRFGENTAVRVRSYDEARHGFDITEAWKRARGQQARLGPPKNGKERFVHLRGSNREAVAERVEEVRREHGPDGLLFPGPKGWDKPWSEGEMRNVFVRAARDAGWELTGGGTTPKGQKYRPHPVIPFMNLRHHSATWMKERGMTWEAVSDQLGHHSYSFTHARYVRKSQDQDQHTRSVLDDA